MYAYKRIVLVLEILLLQKCIVIMVKKYEISYFSALTINTLLRYDTKLLFMEEMNSQNPLLTLFTFKYILMKIIRDYPLK